MGRFNGGRIRPLCAFCAFCARRKSARALIPATAVHSAWRGWPSQTGRASAYLPLPRDAGKGGHTLHNLLMNVAPVVVVRILIVIQRHNILYVVSLICFCPISSIDLPKLILQRDQYRQRRGVIVSPHPPVLSPSWDDSFMRGRRGHCSSRWTPPPTRGRRSHSPRMTPASFALPASQASSSTSTPPAYPRSEKTS